jgi:hypothetical protein
MKKLLATSALISTVALSSVSFAQTTVSGSLDLTYRSTKGGTGQGDTFMGRETQLNIANKGKLSNGLDYAAGFSLEFDGMQTRSATATTSVDNEAVYLNLINGGTTVTVGLDWIQNSKNDLIGSVGDIIDEVGTVVPGGKTLLLDNFGAAQVKESIGAGVVQNFGNGLTGSIFYAPNYNNTGGGNNGQSLNNSTGTNGAYEIGLRGSNIANSGVNLNLWKNETTKATGETKALSGTAMTIGYAKAPFSFDIGKMNTTATTAIETDSKLAQVSYSINKDITASLVRVDTTRNTVIADTSGTSKERINSLMVGYSLGPVGVLLTASRIENAAGISTNADIDQLGVTLSTRF